MNAKDWKCPECGCALTAEEIEAIEKANGEKFNGKCPDCGFGSDIEAPKEIPTLTVSKKQLGILVLDNSGSMSTVTQEMISKNDVVRRSVRELFEKFKTSARKHAFCVAVVGFNEKATKRLDITEVDDINIHNDFQPKDSGGGTFLHTGLEEAEKIADAFLSSSDDVYRSVVMVLMTDGLDMKEELSKATADRLKEKYGKKLKITASCFVGRDLSSNDKKAVMAFLKTIVTEDDMCIETATAEELREFFMRSVSK